MFVPCSDTTTSVMSFVFVSPVPRNVCTSLIIIVLSFGLKETEYGWVGSLYWHKTNFT